MLIVLKQRIIIEKSSEKSHDHRLTMHIQSQNPLSTSVFLLPQ